MLNVRNMFFTRCKFSHCMWFLLFRCKWFCCLCSHVYLHIYDSIVITIPIVDGFFLSIVITIPSVDGFFFLFYYIQVSKLLFTNYCWFKYTKYKFPSSGYQTEFSPRPLPVFHCFTRLERGLISSFTRILFFLNSTDSQMTNTKQVRYQVW